MFFHRSNSMSSGLPRHWTLKLCAASRPRSHLSSPRAAGCRCGRPAPRSCAVGTVLQRPAQRQVFQPVLPVQVTLTKHKSSGKYPQFHSMQTACATWFLLCRKLNLLGYDQIKHQTSEPLMHPMNLHEHDRISYDEPGEQISAKECPSFGRVEGG